MNNHIIVLPWRSVMSLQTLVPNQSAFGGFGLCFYMLIRYWISVAAQVWWIASYLPQTMTTGASNGSTWQKPSCLSRRVLNLRGGWDTSWIIFNLHARLVERVADICRRGAVRVWYSFDQDAISQWWADSSKNVLPNAKPMSREQIEDKPVPSKHFPSSRKLHILATSYDWVWNWHC